MLFSKFFEIISKELNQIREYGDSDTNYQYLNEQTCLDYVNETIIELVDLNPRIFKEEYTHIFNEESYTFTLPAIFYKILGYYDSIDGVWRIPADSSDMTKDLRSTSDKTLTVITPWQKGDELLLRVVKFPPEIASESDAVPFPSQYMRFLRLEIIQKVMGTVGKSWNDLVQQEYLRRLNDYRLANPAIQTSMRIRSYGARFGN